MAKVRASASSGGGLTETILWTNANPTSEFAAQDVTLSQSMQNFTLLKVDFILGNGASYVDTKYSLIIPVSDFVRTRSYGTYPNFMPAMIASTNSNAMYARYYYYVDDTTVHIMLAYRIGLSGYTGTHSIPQKIVGMK